MVIEYYIDSLATMSELSEQDLPLGLVLVVGFLAQFLIWFEYSE